MQPHVDRETHEVGDKGVGVGLNDENVQRAHSLRHQRGGPRLKRADPKPLHAQRPGDEEADYLFGRQQGGPHAAQVEEGCVPEFLFKPGRDQCRLHFALANLGRKARKPPGAEDAQPGKEKAREAKEKPARQASASQGNGSFCGGGKAQRHSTDDR